jgi:uncharacterized protein
VNMAMFAWPHMAIATGRPWPTAADTIAWTLISIFAAGKFYAIFSFLFGVGLSIQLTRARMRGQSPGPLVRRMVMLLLIGAAHIVLLWSGDILHLYAIFGLILLLFAGRSVRTLVGCGGVLVVIPIALGLFLAMIFAGFGDSIQADLQKAAVEREAAIESLITVYSSGTFGEIVRARIGEWASTSAKGVVFYPLLMGLFLLGFAAERSGWIRHLLASKDRPPDPPADEPVMTLGLAEAAAVVEPPRRGDPDRILGRVIRIGLVAGLPLAMITTFLERRVIADETSLLIAPMMLTYVAGNLLLASAYAALIAAACRRGVGPLLGRVGSVGRMALTNYLMHSVIATTIFYAYGLALYGRVGPAIGLLITAAIYVLQLYLSPWWLARFRFGPVEWLWRAATYLRRP